MILLQAAEAWAFWLSVPIIVALALGLVLAAKPVHSALCMAGVMIGLAVQYASLDAPFLFVVQIIVYTGAVMMMFLFVVMLIGVDTRETVLETMRGHRIASIVAIAALGLLLVLGIASLSNLGAATGLATANVPDNPTAVAQLLFTRWIVLLEATSALLITAAIGAMVLAHGEKLAAKKTQTEQAKERMERYARTGEHPGSLPNSGVFARHNAIHVPALLPDGSVAEASVTPTLLTRGAVVNVDDLRKPTQRAFRNIEADRATLEGAPTDGPSSELEGVE